MHRQTGDERRFRGACPRADERVETDAARSLGRDQGTVHRTQPPIERELAEHQYPARALARQLIAGGQDRDRHREVVTGPELRDVARCEIDDDPALRPPQLARDDAGTHALASLADRPIGQPDDNRRSVLAPTDPSLDLHELALDADRRLAVGGCDHRARLWPHSAT